MDYSLTVAIGNRIIEAAVVGCADTMTSLKSNMSWNFEAMICTHGMTQTRYRMYIVYGGIPKQRCSQNLLST